MHESDAATDRPNALSDPSAWSPSPAVLTRAGDTFTVQKRFRIRGHLRETGPVVYPENWPLLSPIFQKVERVSDDVVHEQITFRVRGLVLQSFEVFLRCRYTETDRLIRVDYSLIHERDDKIVVDEGYGEVRSSGTDAGFVRCTARKTLSFASPYLNLLAPAFMIELFDAGPTER